MNKKLFIIVLALIIIGAGFVVGRGILAEEFIQVRGSDTQVNLTQQLAETYMEEYSDATLSVTGGGSGTGIAALINGQVDIANSSREISETEIQQARDQGIEPVRIIIAMDGLSVITHEDNPVEALTVEEIGKIFRGEITNWKELGGEDREISPYGRQSNSGTFVYFRENVLQDDYTDKMMRMNGNAQIVEGVMADRGAIGYVGIGYVVEDGKAVEGVNIINVAVDEDSEAATPLNPKNVATGKYPIARPLNQYIDGQPEGAIRDFMEFIVSEKGQEIAVNAGFYPISPEFQEENEKVLD